MNAAHAEFRKILLGLSGRTLPNDVLAVLHASRRVVAASGPLFDHREQAIACCTQWRQLVAIADQVEADA